MVGFYKHDIPAWMDGTEALSDGAYRTYHVIVQLIMLNEGPIALNERGLAGRCNQSIKSFRVNLKELLDGKKLTLVDGRLFNERAATELHAVFKNRSNASLGGKSGGKSAENSSEQRVAAGEQPISPDKPLKDNNTALAPLEPDLSLKEKSRVEKSREDISPSLRSGENPPARDLFVEGVVVPFRQQATDTTAEEPAAGKKRKSKRVEAPWPEGFGLDDALRRYAAERGYGKSADQDRMLSQFRNRAQAKGLTYVDWRAAWRTWVDHQLGYDRQRAYGTTGPPRRAPDV